MTSEEDARGHGLKTRSLASLASLGNSSSRSISVLGAGGGGWCKAMPPERVTVVRFVRATLRWRRIAGDLRVETGEYREARPGEGTDG